MEIALNESFFHARVALLTTCVLKRPRQKKSGSDGTESLRETVTGELRPGNLPEGEQEASEGCPEQLASLLFPGLRENVSCRED